MKNQNNKKKVKTRIDILMLQFSFISMTWSLIWKTIWKSNSEGKETIYEVIILVYCGEDGS